MKKSATRGAVLVVLQVALGLSAWGCAACGRYFCRSCAASNMIVTIDSTPQGAVGVASNGRVVKTPVLMQLKSNEPVSFEFTKEGYEPVEVNISSRLNYWILANILTGGLGLFYDIEQGATQTLSPRSIHLELKELRPQK